MLHEHSMIWSSAYNSCLLLIFWIPTSISIDNKKLYKNLIKENKEYLLLEPSSLNQLPLFYFLHNLLGLMEYSHHPTRSHLSLLHPKRFFFLLGLYQSFFLKKRTEHQYQWLYLDKQSRLQLRLYALVA